MATLSHAELLRRLPLFKSLSPSQVDALAIATDKKRFKRNECIVQAGQKSHALILILSGNARVILMGDNGRELVWGSLQSGDYIGEMSLLDDQPHSVTVIAETPLDALVLGHAAFNNCLLQNGALAVAVMRGMVGSLRKANQKISDLALVSVQGRVARCLTEMAVPMPTDSTKAIVKKISKAKLAREIGASREMVSKALKQFEIQGFILPMEDGSLLLTEHLAKAKCG